MQFERFVIKLDGLAGGKGLYKVSFKTIEEGISIIEKFEKH